jgi:glycolate oxidase
MGRLKPDMLCMDGTIPRGALPEMLERISTLSDRYGLICCNVFHAGDGNLHPLILFDHRDPDQFRRARDAGTAIMQLCIEMGGTLTGEHGVGMEKNELMPLMFSEADLELMRKVRAAFNPFGRLNPGKVLPLRKGCGEARLQPLPVSVGQTP